jgi:hypothetical protein
MKIKDLKELLKQQGLPVSGNKPDLIARLTAAPLTAAPSMKQSLGDK